MSYGQTLRRLMGEKMVVAPFCLNAYHAKIAQMVGFEAVYMTGWGTAAERGYPDVGLITQTEMVENARYIANAVDLPVIADADTGYGNSINVWRTVREHESAGVAAIHIEDQVFPKKCGFFEGKEVIPTGENVQKIKAALDARRDKDFVIIARCDALAVNGWEDTIQRCHAYHEAGADLIFVDGIRTTDDLKRYAKDFKEIPKLYNGGLLPTHEVADMGFKMMITARTNLLIFKAVKEAFETLKEKGTVMEEFKTTNSDLFKEAADMLGLSAIYEMEKRYKD
jgi:2,3-dimethylmalate lyase